jgi:hypothetical protein
MTADLSASRGIVFSSNLQKRYSRGSAEPRLRASIKPVAPTKHAAFGPARHAVSLVGQPNSQDFPMNRTFVRIFSVAVIATGLMGQNASAGVFADELTKCLVKSSSTDDRVLLVQWMFAALSLHPAVQPMVQIKADQRDAATKKAGGIFSRLLAENCRKESVAALKNEGNSAIGAAFGVLGQVASRDLMSNPNVEKGMGDLGTQLEGDPKLAALLKEAGPIKK